MKHFLHLVEKDETLFASCQKNWNTFGILLKKIETLLAFCQKKLKQFSYWCEKSETLFAYAWKNWNTFPILLKKLKHVSYSVKKTETNFAICRKKMKHFSRFVEKNKTILASCRNKSLQFYIKVLRFLPYHLRKKVRILHNFWKNQEKRTFYKKKFFVFLHFAKLLREFLVHVKKSYLHLYVKNCSS